MKHQVALVAAVLVAFSATPSLAKFRTTVTKTDAFHSAKIETAAFVTVGCDDSVDCYAIERKAALEAAKLSIPFSIVPERRVRDLLLGKGHAAYSPELRQLLVDELGVDALFEIEVPSAEKGDGYGRQSEPERVAH